MREPTYRDDIHPGFRNLPDRFQGNPSGRFYKCLFIDDSEANVVAAKELGFMTILFESPQQLSTELSTRGLL